MKYDIILIYVDYEEYQPETYNGVYLHAETEIKRYNTGNFFEDLESAKAFAKQNSHSVLFSSSVDHFKSDTE